jgi:hypothetical protein
MAGTTTLELATSAVTVRFYNNLQDRGDCQTTRKSYKTRVFVGWLVGWKQSDPKQPHIHFPEPRFSGAIRKSSPQREMCEVCTNPELNRGE